MSGEGSKTPSGQGLPYSWLHLFSGLSALLVAAIVCAALIAQFLASRPVNLETVCTELAGMIEEVLTTNQIPRPNIGATSGELRQDERAKWRHFEFAVEVPDNLSAAGVATVLTKDMALRNVSARREGKATASSETLALALGTRDFARIRLTAKPGRSDLSAASSRVAREVLSLLDTTPPIWTKSNDQTLTRENEGAVWLLRRVDAALAPGTKPTAIQNLIEGAMGRRDVYVAAEKDDAETVLTVLYDDVPCLVMHLRQMRELPQVQLPTLATPAPPDEEPPASPEQAQGKSATDGKPTSTDARVVIIVDDGGQNESVDRAILALDNALTLAILPNERFSAATAGQASDLGFEVMVHMPMESDTKRWNEPGQLYVKMKPEEIRKRVEAAIKGVPGAVGMNNHTGGVFTSSKAAMKSLLAVLKEQDFYFIDSRTTAATVAHNTAQAMKVPSASRNVFLDNEPDLDYIRGQFDELVAKAREEGTAIGICHFRHTTATALTETIPQIRKAGVAIVHASEVVQ